MIRSLYPIDLVSLPFLSRGLLTNEAISRDGVEKRNLLTPQALLQHWFPLKRTRYTWLWLNLGRVHGVVSVRSCYGRTVWQIDYLRASDEERCFGLLDRLAASGVKKGVKKVFLRLSSDSSLMDGARRSGFSCYSREYLYRYDGAAKLGIAGTPGSYQLRPRWSSDEYKLFQLYSAAVPTPVRSAEGLTLAEWRESRDRGSWLEHRREFVLEKEDSLVGWLRLSTGRGMGYFEAVFSPADESLQQLVNWGLVCLDGKSPLFCMVSAYQEPLRKLLQGLGFEETAEYCAMVKELALKVREPSLMPARV